MCPTLMQGRGLLSVIGAPGARRGCLHNSQAPPAERPPSLKAILQRKLQYEALAAVSAAAGKDTWEIWAGRQQHLLQRDLRFSQKCHSCFFFQWGIDASLFISFPLPPSTLIFRCHSFEVFVKMLVLCIASYSIFIVHNINPIMTGKIMSFFCYFHHFVSL